MCTQILTLTALVFVLFQDRQSSGHPYIEAMRCIETELVKNIGLPNISQIKEKNLIHENYDTAIRICDKKINRLVNFLLTDEKETQTNAQAEEKSFLDLKKYFIEGAKKSFIN